MKLDTSGTRRFIHDIKLAINDNAHRYKGLPARPLSGCTEASEYLANYCQSQFQLALAQFVFHGDVNAFKNSLKLLVPSFFSIYRTAACSEEPVRGSQYNVHDSFSLSEIIRCANEIPADTEEEACWKLGVQTDAALFLAYYLTIIDRKKAIETCQLTNYGTLKHFENIPKHAGAGMRAMRAFILNETRWLRDETDYLQEHDSDQRLLEILKFPRRPISQSYRSLFYGDEHAFHESIRMDIEWYHAWIERVGCDSHSTYGWQVAINWLALMLIKIAIAYRGYSVKIDDQFIPMELIIPS